MKKDSTSFRNSQASTVKYLLLTCLALVTLGVNAQADEVFDFKTTLPILNDKFHTSCRLHAGYNLTMINCADQFEVYDTQLLEDQQSLLTNFGESRQITGVRNSLKSNDHLSITFLEDEKVMRLSRDPNFENLVIKIDELMELSLADNNFVSEAWVMDGMVAVRVNDTEFHFFMEPLVSSEPVIALLREPQSISNQDFDYSELLAYTFAPNKYTEEYKLFALRDKELVKIVFTFDEDEFWIKEDITTITDTSFNGTHMRIKVTADFVIVSNSDGAQPGVSFFDHEWNLIEFFPRLLLLEAPYNIEVFEVPDLNMLQVYIAGTNDISIIEVAHDQDNKAVFKLTNQVWDPPTIQPYTSDQTYVAKSGDFVVIKQSSKRNLDIMPICSYKYAYQSADMSCRHCEPGLKSYGLQDDQCLTCSRAWLLSDDPFREVQYLQFCEDGYAFSLTLFIVVPVIVMIAAILLCCCTKANGIINSDNVCDESNPKHKNVRRREGISRNGTRYVRRTASRKLADMCKLEQDRQDADKAQGDQLDTDRNNQRLETEAPIMSGRETEMNGDRNLDDDRYEDYGESQDFSDTENEHFEAPGANQARTLRDRQGNISMESNEVERADITNREDGKSNIRATAKTNVRDDGREPSF